MKDYEDNPDSVYRFFAFANKRLRLGDRVILGITKATLHLGLSVFLLWIWEKFQPSSLTKRIGEKAGKAGDGLDADEVE